MIDAFKEPISPARDYESEETELKSDNQGFNNKNYVFNNCTVTINEEGKAIGILQEQEARKAKTQEVQIKMIEKVIETISSTVSSVLIARSKKQAPRKKKVTPEKGTMIVPIGLGKSGTMKTRFSKRK